MKAKIIFKNSKDIIQKDYSDVEDIKIHDDRILIYHQMTENDKKMNIKDFTSVPKRKIAKIELDFIKRD